MGSRLLVLIGAASMLSCPGALAQDGTLSFDGGGNFRPNRQLVLPAETYSDLFAVGAQSPEAPLVDVRGLSRPLPETALDDIGVLYSFAGEDERAAAGANLVELATDYPVLNNVVAGAIDVGLFVGDRSSIEFLNDAVQEGDIDARTAIDQRYIFSPSGARADALDRTSLELMFRSGEAPGAASTLAQYHQFGVDGAVDAVKADLFWKQAIEDSNNNPADVLAYAQFLRAEGRTEEALGYLYEVQYYAPAAAEGYELSLEVLGAVTNEQMANIAALAEAGHAPAALQLARESHALGGLERAEYYYLKAINGLADRTVYRAMALSGLGWLYYENPGALPNFSVENATARFDEAVDLGDPGGLLGLAYVAYDNNRPQTAYALASRAADLGEDWQIAKANELQVKICAPGAAIDCVPVPVFFVTTREAVAENGITRFNNNGDPDGAISYGMAFVRVPLTTDASARRVALYEASKTQAEALFTDTSAAFPTSRDIAILDGANLDDLMDSARAVANGEMFDGRAFVYVHGFNNPFDAALRATAEATEHGGFPSVPILLSWSSRANPFQYVADMAAADSGCAALLPALKKVGEVFGGENMTVLAHSMGSQVVYAMIGGCKYNSSLFWDLDTPIGNVIYAAPDMTRKDFVDNFANHADRATAITLYASENDTALLLSQSVAFNAVERAGIGGDGKRIVLEKLSTIDASRVEANLFSGGDLSNHGYVFSRPEVIADLRLLMNGKTTIDGTQRPCLEAGTGEQLSYWWVKRDCLQ